MDGTLTEITNDSLTATGLVRWFDPAKGYGFVQAANVDGDILLHQNVIKEFGQNSACEGCRVECIYEKSPTGLRATQILALYPPAGTSAPVIEDLGTIAVRVSWFDQKRGFGFVHDFETGQEIFMHISTVRAHGLSEVQAGEALRVRCADEQRGKVVRSIYPWVLSR